MSKYLTPEQVSKNLNIAIGTLYNWVCQRKIPFIKLGKLIRFREEDIEKWLQSKEIKFPS